MSIAVLTDSNSGFTKNEAQYLGIHMINMPIIIEDRILYEWENVTSKDVFDAISAGKKVFTSQPSCSQVLEAWMSLLESHDEVVYIPMSSALSSSCETAIGLSRDFENRVKVVDNHRISVTLRESVITAKKMADNGCSSDEIKKFLEKEAYNSVIYLAVNDLRSLKRGGRIGSFATIFGTIFSIKPIMIIKGGKIELLEKIRGKMKKCELRIVEAIKNDLKTKFKDEDTKNLKIGAAGAGLNDAQKEELVGILKDNFPNSDVYYNPLSVSVSCHTGKDAVGVGVSFF